MAEIWERTNALEYSATKNSVLTYVGSKSLNHTRVFVRLSVAPFAAIGVGESIEIDVMMNGSKIGGASPTEWYSQSVELINHSGTTTWLMIPFLFRGWDPDEMVLNVNVIRRNIMLSGTPSTTRLLVRRVNIYSGL